MRKLYCTSTALCSCGLVTGSGKDSDTPAVILAVSKENELLGDG